jgi:hypothetical protein
MVRRMFDFPLFCVNDFLEVAACSDCKSFLAVPIKYQFLQQVNLFPYQEKYHIGDTIRFAKCCKMGALAGLLQ